MKWEDVEYIRLYNAILPLYLPVKECIKLVCEFHHSYRLEDALWPTMNTIIPVKNRCATCFKIHPLAPLLQFDCRACWQKPVAFGIGKRIDKSNASFSELCLECLRWRQCDQKLTSLRSPATWIQFEVCREIRHRAIQVICPICDLIWSRAISGKKRKLCHACNQPIGRKERLNLFFTSILDACLLHLNCPAPTPLQPCEKIVHSIHISDRNSTPNVFCACYGKWRRHRL